MTHSFLTLACRFSKRHSKRCTMGLFRMMVSTPTCWTRIGVSVDNHACGPSWSLCQTGIDLRLMFSDFCTISFSTLPLQLVCTSAHCLTSRHDMTPTPQNKKAHFGVCLLLSLSNSDCGYSANVLVISGCKKTRLTTVLGVRPCRTRPITSTLHLKPCHLTTGTIC